MENTFTLKIDAHGTYFDTHTQILSDVLSVWYGEKTIMLLISLSLYLAYISYIELLRALYKPMANSRLLDVESPTGTKPIAPATSMPISL
jgi:hypothetical protein